VARRAGARGLPAVLSLALALVPALPAGAAEFHPRQVGILWQVDTGRAEPSWILGTVHSDDPRVLALPAPVRRAFARARSFTAEVALDPGAALALMGRMALPEGERLSRMLDAATWQGVKRHMGARGYPEPVVDRLKPWSVALTLSLPRPRSGMFLDMKLYMDAVAAGKAVGGLETVDEQASYLDDLPRATQIAMLEAALAEQDRLPRLLEQIIDAWLKRDLNALERLSERQLRGQPAAVAQVFRQRLLRQRNRLMVERMAPRLAEGRAFIAVGALHLPGREGVLELLRRKGYRVTAVY